jgi:hypothetical protein
MGNKLEGATVFDTESVFGEGMIAVLFICNTGNISEALFENSIVSLAADLLKQGYQVVVAPFWKLDVTITSFWLTEFISSFKAGYSISESVYMANKEIAKYQARMSSAFYAPEAQLAMHLYVNQNIYID